MKYYIITGSSKGLGKPLTTKLMGSDSHIFCISRKKNKKLQEAARKISASMDYFEFDLNSPEGHPALKEEIFKHCVSFRNSAMIAAGAIRFIVIFD